MTNKITEVEVEVAEAYMTPTPSNSRKSSTDKAASQWAVSGSLYKTTGKVVAELPPDLYKPVLDSTGIKLMKMNFSTEDLFRFTDSNLDKVVSHIEDFWSFKDKFNEFGFPHRRGILLYGPPGSGKTCAIKLIVKQVIENGGIAMQFEEANWFSYAMQAFRKVQPETPVVVVMEDLDALLNAHDESVILNLLDGVAGFENIVYLATTNYPEELDPRIKNRPSRFDRRFEIGLPQLSTRHEYITFLANKVSNNNINVNEWAEKTDRLTLAHIKDLFISVVLFEQSFDETLATLKEMGKKIHSKDFDSTRSGFGNS